MPGSKRSAFWPDPEPLQESRGLDRATPPAIARAPLEPHDDSTDLSQKILIVLMQLLHRFEFVFLKFRRVRIHTVVSGHNCSFRRRLVRYRGAKRKEPQFCLRPVFT